MIRTENRLTSALNRSGRISRPDDTIQARTTHFNWLAKAEAGDAEAMVKLGIFYDRDNDLDKAFFWYDKAIQAGSERGRA